MKILKAVEYPFISLWVSLIITYSYILLRLKKFDKAEKCLNKISKYDVKKHYVYNNLAYIYMIRDRDYKRGKDALEAAMKEKPKYTITLLNLSYLYIKLEEYGKAKEMTEKMMKTWVGRSVVYNNLSVIYIRQEKFDEAKEAVKKALKKRRFLNLVYHNKGIIEEKSGNFEESIKSFKKSKKIGLRQHTNYSLARVYARTGDYKNAVKELNEYINKNPEAYVFNEDITVWENIENEEVKTLINLLPIKTWKEI